MKWTSVALPGLEEQLPVDYGPKAALSIYMLLYLISNLAHLHKASKAHSGMERKWQQKYHS